MIKIRYRDPNELSPGLHAAAERHGRSTTVYLLTGLNKQQRQAALRRLRLSARMGYCPALPSAQLALALFADRLRTSIRRTGAVFRLHPAGSTVPVMVVSGGAIVFLLLSTVSIHVLRPRAAEALPGAGAPPIASATAAPRPVPSKNPDAGSVRFNQAGFAAGQATQTPPRGSGLTSPALSGPGTGAGAGVSSGVGSASTGNGAGNGGTTTSVPPSAAISPAPAPAPTSGGSSGSGSSGSGSSGSGSSGSGSSGSGSSGSGSSGSGSSGSGSSGSGSSGSSGSGSGTSGSDPTSGGSTSGGSTSGTGICVDLGPLGVCLDL